MKLSKADLDNKMSIAEMKQIKAGSVTSSTGNATTTSKVGRDTDKGNGPSDTGW